MKANSIHRALGGFDDAIYRGMERAKHPRAGDWRMGSSSAGVLVIRLGDNSPGQVPSAGSIGSGGLNPDGSRRGRQGASGMGRISPADPPTIRIGPALIGKPAWDRDGRCLDRHTSAPSEFACVTFQIGFSVAEFGCRLGTQRSPPRPSLASDSPDRIGGSHEPS